MGHSGRVLLKTMFAMSAMGKHTEPVRQALLAGDLELGRSKAAMMVSRDVSQLDKEHVISCAAESAAENTVDSIFSPLFYFGLLGLPPPWPTASQTPWTPWWAI